ncbi:hypothetical protein BJV78DRAFT_1198493 [Lactifluus subvellereus]|nr:hypothetical protein BJV78DRAFT_1198493 [Lactifluus subvellereus]
MTRCGSSQRHPHCCGYTTITSPINELSTHCYCHLNNTKLSTMPLCRLLSTFGCAPSHHRVEEDVVMTDATQSAVTANSSPTTLTTAIIEKLWKTFLGRYHLLLVSPLIDNWPCTVVRDGRQPGRPCSRVMRDKRWSSGRVDSFPFHEVVHVMVS